ncbi:hypothetical protein [Halobellus limi]|jgi:hypothetical protein|uniref:Uncharacterized protein n=1 Tax=Halobellus limi TaxID=699433 RepID=A0A1H5YF25_9EURY|nr:hypothetical protein [Halobellus limi]QCC48474.1 hypothetical protein DV707_12810 [Halobellus limi]SEG22709.1 hypothetical protein SAMN04488133_1568 [Halobellus limi]
MSGRRSPLEFFGGLLAAVVGLTAAVWGSAQGWSFPAVFVAVALSWSGYLFAHHGETGRFVDAPGTGDDPNVPASRSKRLGVVVAGVGMALAFPLGIHALVVDSVVLLAAAATAFVGGYASGHWLLTGTAL